MLWIPELIVAAIAVIVVSRLRRDKNQWESVARILAGRGAVVESRHLRAGSEHRDVLPILIARTAIERGMLRIGIAVGNLWEASGLERGIAVASRQRVVAAEAHACAGAALKGPLSSLAVDG